MRYSSLDAVKEKRLHIGPFEYGTDVSKEPLYINKSALSEAKNVIYSGGILKTRPGLYSDSEHVIKSEYSSDSFFNTCEISRNDFYINNTFYKIIMETSQVDFSQFSLTFHLIDQNRDMLNIGSMQFYRVTDTVFYVPSNVTLFQAKPQKGCGLYAFITLSNMGNYTETLNYIYELSSDMLSWNKIENYYIPTVYINGRGDMYKTSEDAGNIISENPKLLEAPNMLNGIFYAYYSSDGYSSSFALPYSNISDEKVSCRIYYSLNAYTDWTINAGETSKVKEFMGAKVTMNIDRSKGIVYFTVESGDYAVPYMSKYNLNNIRITATKKDPTAFSDIVSCTCCLVCDSRIVLAGGNKLNRIYTAHYDNPLYFPQSNYTEIGQARLPIKALTLQKDKILAFKSNGIYRITLTKGEGINTASLLADNDSYFYKSDSLTVNRMDSQLGCARQSAITTLCGKTFFCGTDSNFYCITDSFSIKLISQKIKEYLKVFPNEILNEIVLLNDGKHCYFFLNNQAYVCCTPTDSDYEKTAWYVWEFPEEVTVSGGISYENSPVLLCSTNYATNYTAVLEGNEDILLDITNEDEPFKAIKISSKITTPCFTPAGVNSKIKLNRIYLQLSAKGNPEIKLNGKTVDFTHNPIENLPDGINKVIIFPEIRTHNSVCLTLESDEYLAFSQGDIYYV